MMRFQDYARSREISDLIAENNLFYHKDFMRSLASSRPEEPSPLGAFFDRLASNLRVATGRGLDLIPQGAWERIRSGVLSLSRPSGEDVLSVAKGLPEGERASDEEVREALAELRAEARRAGISPEEMRMYLSILNRVIKTSVASGSVDRPAYYNALRSFIEDPARFMQLTRPTGGWTSVMQPVARALSVETSPERKAAEIVASSVKGSPEEEAVRDALRKTLDDMSDAEVRSIAWADRRTRRGRESVGRITGAYGVDHADLSRELESRPELRQRLRRARRDKSSFRRRNSEQ